MSEKMKGVALDQSPYGSYEDARARFKHQSLIQDYQELEKETKAKKNKLKIMKQRKLTLLAEVRFLRRRHKYLLEMKLANPSQGHKLSQTHDILKEKICSQKTTNLQTKTPILGVNLKEMSSIAKKSMHKIMESCVNPKEMRSSGKEAFLRNTNPGFDLNQKESEYAAKEVVFKIPSPVLHLNQKEANFQSRNSDFDLNLIERPCAMRGNVVQVRAPVFDLNIISGEEESQDNNCGALRSEEALKLSTVCRNVENVPNRSGKRKISWQDPVALKV